MLQRLPEGIIVTILNYCCWSDRKSLLQTTSLLYRKLFIIEFRRFYSLCSREEFALHMSQFKTPPHLTMLKNKRISEYLRCKESELTLEFCRALIRDQFYESKHRWIFKLFLKTYHQRMYNYQHKILTSILKNIKEGIKYQIKAHKSVDYSLLMIFGKYFYFLYSKNLHLSHFNKHMRLSCEYFQKINKVTEIERLDLQYTIIQLCRNPRGANVVSPYFDIE